MNTEQALSEIGTRLKRRRLNMDRSQKEIADRAGIGINSVARLEDGKGATLANFIRVLNALEALDSLDACLPLQSAPSNWPNFKVNYVRKHRGNHDELFFVQCLSLE